MTRAAPILVMVFVALALALWLQGNRGKPTSPSGTVTTETRIPKLKKQITEQEVECAQAVAKYVPTTKTPIDDLGLPVVDLLRSLPGVVEVEVGVPATKPTSRIIHLRDWHFVPKELYTLDLKAAHGRELTAEEIDRLHQELLLEVELVQLEQMTVLRCLIKHHGLKRVFSEGFSPKELVAYREKMAVLRSMEKEQIPHVRKQLDEVRKLVKGSAGEGKENAQVIETQLVTMLEEHKHRLLEMGAAGRLLISDELEDMLPLEDSDLLDRAKPVTPEGKIRLDRERVKDRNDAQVKAVMDRGGFGLIVLGGAHDLSDSVRRLGQGRCEYLRVTTKRFQEIDE